jgi:hypothetical protein
LVCATNQPDGKPTSLNLTTQIERSRRFICYSESVR